LKMLATERVMRFLRIFPCSSLTRRPLRAALFSDDARLRDPRPARAHILLGVAANAPLDDIKDAYWRLAKRTHPDSNRGDEEAATLFTRLTRAYEAMTKHAKSGGTSGSVDVVRVSEAPAHSQRKAVSHAKAIFLDVSGDMERLGNALNNEVDRLAALKSEEGGAASDGSGGGGSGREASVLSSSGGPDWGGLWGMADMMAAEREQQAVTIAAKPQRMPPKQARAGAGASSSTSAAAAAAAAAAARGGGGGRARDFCTEVRAETPHMVYFALEDERRSEQEVGAAVEEDAHALLAGLGCVLNLTAQAHEQVLPLELSLTLCGDAHIAALNVEWRGVDSATDVLSFPMFQFSSGAPLLRAPPPPSAGGGDHLLHTPAPCPEQFDRELAEAVADCAGTLNAGELVISLDTARRQAREINDAAAAAAHASSAAASLAETERDVLRILLTHGVLHLLGFTHDDLLDDKRSLSYATAMGRAEDAVMKHLGWKGQGLVFAHFA
jgi:ssRNA-specific RNase YbeY (16S rRNA maturation enzyme)